MHAVLLGVTKQYTTLLLSNFGRKYYVGSPTNLRHINNLLTAIRPPFCISRAPRVIESFRNWKATEWRNWLLFYAPVCLYGILENKYFSHFGLLSRAIYKLLAKNTTAEELSQAEVELTKVRYTFSIFTYCY